jgi:transposase
MAACYDGENPWTVELPDCSSEDKTIALCREQLRLVTIGSKKHKKFSARMAKAQRRKQNMLSAAQHRFVHKLIQRRPRYIVIENINIAELSDQNGGAYRHGWCKAQANGWRRLLIEKGLAAQNGITIIAADQYFPSTLLCPNPYCGIKKDGRVYTTTERWYDCECGADQDRDEAAAVSLWHYGMLQVHQDATEGYAPSYLKWKAIA